MYSTSSIRSGLLSALLVVFLVTMVADVRAQGIFIPGPRDGDGGGGEDAAKDVVHIRGAYPALKGQVVTVDARGRLRLRAPFLATDALLLTRYVSHVTFNPTETDGGRDRVMLSNGDYISGELVSIRSDSILVEAGGGRLVKVPRNIIVSVETGDVADTLMESKFATADIRPWKIIQGRWSSGFGSLIASRSSYRSASTGPGAIGADIVQKGAVTVDVEFVMSTVNSYFVSFYSADKNVPYGRSAVSLSVTGTRADVRVTRQGASTTMGSVTRTARQGEKIKLLCSYEPKTGRVRAWINGRKICDKTHPAPFLKEGSCIVVSGSGSSSLRFKAIRLYRGVVEPSGRVARGEPDHDSVFTANGDRISAKSLKASNNTLVAETGMGPVTIDMAKVTRIVFRSKGRVTPEPGEANVTMLTAGSRLTVKLTGVTSERLLGRSVVLGKVDIPRKVLRELHFIARKPATPVAEGGAGVGEIHVPQPRQEPGSVGDGEQIGKDVVHIRGEFPAMPGTVVSVDGRGRLKLHTPFFATDALLLISQISHVTLGHTKADGGRDRILLSNGDYVSGELVSIDAGNVVLETGGGRIVKIPRSIVISIGAGQAGNTLVDSEFDTASMEPWKPIGDALWRSGSGALICRRGQYSRTTRICAVAADVVQKEAVTMEVNLQINTGNAYYLSFFAADKNVSTPRTCISVNVGRGTAGVTVVRQGTSATVGSVKWRAATQAKKVKVLCSYEPATGRVRAWIADRRICDRVLPGAFLKEGKHVVVAAVVRGNYGVTIESIRIHRGVMEPAGRADRADPNHDTVYTVSGDRLSAKSLKLAGNQLTVETAIGPVTIDMAKVSRIIFRTKGRTKPEAGDANVTVQTAGSRLALKLMSMDAEEFVGNSPVLGKVELPRGVLKELRFIVPE